MTSYVRNSTYVEGSTWQRRTDNERGTRHSGPPRSKVFGRQTLVLLYSVQAQIHHKNLLCGKIVTQPNWTQEKTLKLLSEKVNSLPFYPLCKTQIQFLYNVIQFPSKFSQSFIECVLYNPLVKWISSTLILIRWALFNLYMYNVLFLISWAQS